jgi:hypothetical protein
LGASIGSRHSGLGVGLSSAGHGSAAQARVADTFRPAADQDQIGECGKRIREGKVVGTSLLGKQSHRGVIGVGKSGQATGVAISEARTMRTASMLPLVNDRLNILGVHVSRELHPFKRPLFAWMNRCGDSVGS